MKTKQHWGEQLGDFPYRRRGSDQTPDDGASFLAIFSSLIVLVFAAIGVIAAVGAVLHR